MFKYCGCHLHMLAVSVVHCSLSYMLAYACSSAQVAAAQSGNDNGGGNNGKISL